MNKAQKNKEIDLLGVILPIGISFFTFQILSYLKTEYICMNIPKSMV